MLCVGIDNVNWVQDGVFGIRNVLDTDVGDDGTASVVVTNEDANILGFTSVKGLTLSVRVPEDSVLKALACCHGQWLRHLLHKVVVGTSEDVNILHNLFLNGPRPYFLIL